MALIVYILRRKVPLKLCRLTFRSYPGSIGYVTDCTCYFDMMTEPTHFHSDFMKRIKYTTGISHVAFWKPSLDRFAFSNSHKYQNLFINFVIFETILSSNC